jgi:hypothetical protein
LQYYSHRLIAVAFKDILSNLVLLGGLLPSVVVSLSIGDATAVGIKELKLRDDAPSNSNDIMPAV